MKDRLELFFAILSRSPGALFFIVLSMALPMLLLLAGRSAIDAQQPGSVLTAISAGLETAYWIVAATLVVTCLRCAAECYAKTRKRLLGL